jgi:SAM-dependent methyltransferase
VIRSSNQHERVQDAHWERARAEHFEWKIRTPVFAESEAALVEGVRTTGRVLELGCGEGSNLHHLRGTPTAIYGVDRSRAKVAFASERVAGLRAAIADVAQLPFASASFDTILVRDLLHHVYDRGQALAEAWRVLRPGGELNVIEPNVRNPLLLAQAVLVRAERGVLVSTPELLRRELEALPGRGAVEVRMFHPFPIARLVLHPDMGLPSLARLRAVRATLRAVNWASERLIPRSLWSYVTVRIRKNSNDHPA